MKNLFVWLRKKNERVVGNWYKFTIMSPLNKTKKGKKKKKKTFETHVHSAHGHFCQPNSNFFFFSSQFSPYFGKKTFWWVGEKTPGSHHLFFLSPFQPNTFQKVFPPYSLSLFLSPSLSKIYSTKNTLKFGDFIKIWRLYLILNIVIWLLFFGFKIF